MKDLKLCVIGGGSTYVPETVLGIAMQAERDDGVPFTTIYLYDVDMPRVMLVAKFCKRMLQNLGSAIQIQVGSDLVEAVTGSRFVITTMRVGGMQARISDELLGRKHNIIGQETVGVGGFAKARRTIPEVLKVAEAMESHAPGATLLNYTNPAGIVTNAIFNSSRVQVIGLCSIPNDYRAQAALGCGCKPEEVELDYVGLNHFGFIRDVKVNGVSRWAEAFPYMREHTVEEEWGHIPGLAEKMREHIDHLGVMLTYYLQYYLETDLVLAAQQQSSQTRGQYILERIEPELAAAFADDSVCELPEIAKERGGSGYSRAAFELMSGIFHDTEEKRIVCCKNNGALPFLPHAACVEVPALISRKGAEAIEQPEVSPELAGMIAQMCHYETLTARSAYPPNLRTALDALQANPLASREPAKVGELLKEILDKDAAWL